MADVGVILAVADNGVLGRNNALPWHLPEDLRYFKRMTLGKPVVMGRRTLQSIGRPLPGRRNIVVSRDPDFEVAGATVLPSLAQALDLARAIADRDGVPEVMVIGGAQIYAAAIPLADRLYVTEVHTDAAGDTRLPPVDWDQWQEQSRERHEPGEAGAIAFSFVVYARQQPGVSAVGEYCL